MATKVSKAKRECRCKVLILSVPSPEVILVSKRIKMLRKYSIINIIIISISTRTCKTTREKE